MESPECATGMMSLAMAGRGLNVKRLAAIGCIEQMTDVGHVLVTGSNASITRTPG